MSNSSVLFSSIGILAYLWFVFAGSWSQHFEQFQPRRGNQQRACPDRVCFCDDEQIYVATDTVLVGVSVRVL